MIEKCYMLLYVLNWLNKLFERMKLGDPLSLFKTYQRDHCMSYICVFDLLFLGCRLW